MADDREIRTVAGAEEVKLGSFLFTIVEPHRGHEVAYNRWYERDHLYSGCMIGPYNFAARRFVATADLKRSRDPDPSTITGEPGRGSYLALYWILRGYGDVWGRWAGRQVVALHEAGRMFEARDHVHTLLYEFLWEAGRDRDGVPAELALDHPYSGLVAEFLDLEPGEDGSGGTGSGGGVDGSGGTGSGGGVDGTFATGDTWLRDEHLPWVMAGSSAGLVVAARPVPMRAGAPGVALQEVSTRRRLLLWFLDGPPQPALDTLALHRRSVESAGVARVAAVLPFIPTIPGTDTYTDQLWD